MTTRKPDAYRAPDGTPFIVRAISRLNMVPEDWTPLWLTDRDPSGTVTLDPACEADVERLAHALCGVRIGPAGHPSSAFWRANAEMTLAALAQPEPEPTPEPTLLGTVVRDAEGQIFVRLDDDWADKHGDGYRWSALIQPVEILHPGYSPDDPKDAS